MSLTLLTFTAYLQIVRLIMCWVILLPCCHYVLLSAHHPKQHSQNGPNWGPTGGPPWPNWGPYGMLLRPIIQVVSLEAYITSHIVCNVVCVEMVRPGICANRPPLVGPLPDPPPTPHPTPTTHTTIIRPTPFTLQSVHTNHPTRGHITLRHGTLIIRKNKYCISCGSDHIF